MYNFKTLIISVFSYFILSPLDFRINIFLLTVFLQSEIILNDGLVYSQ